MAEALRTIAFRADDSLEIGTGHVMRCLTLADGLAQKQAHCVFLCRPHEGHLIELIEERGHRVAALSAPQPAAIAAGEPAHASWLGASWQDDAEQSLAALAGQHYDWLVVDHYALDERWEKALRSSAKQILVMDDLADRSHDCDLLLDPTLGREAADYAALIPATAKTLLGPNHALLRPEFAAARTASLARRKTGQLQHILVTMGGVDKDNSTCAVLQALDQCPLPEGCHITVVMGGAAPWLDEVKALATAISASCTVHSNVTNMAALMAKADLAIGAAGGTSWERCCMGLPTIMLCLADNQREMARTLQSAGAGLAANSAEEVAKLLTGLLQERLEKGTMTGFLRTASVKAAGVTGGKGCAILMQAMDLKEQGQ